MTIAERFRLARSNYNDHGFQTPEDVIASGVIAQSSLYRIEKGKQKPNLDNVIKLANYYGVTTDWLLMGIEPPKPNLELKAACRYLNLSGAAIENIIKNTWWEYVRNEDDSFPYETPAETTHINSFFESDQIDEFFDRLVSLADKVVGANSEIYKGQSAYERNKDYYLPNIEKYCNEIDIRLLRLIDTIKAITGASEARDNLLKLKKKFDKREDKESENVFGRGNEEDGKH